MREIPKDVAERLYKRYAATLINPMPFGEMMPCKNDIVTIPETISFRVRGAYEKGIVKPDEQLFWIWHAHKKNADLSEPYDVGVLNALALAMYIFSDKEHGFWEKPTALWIAIDLLKQRVRNLQKRLFADQKDYGDKLAERTKVHVAETAKLKEEVKTLEAQLEEANTTPNPETVKEDDQS
jgi:hypothetical protein